jgi:hypothetical protein
LAATLPKLGLDALAFGIRIWAVLRQDRICDGFESAPRSFLLRRQVGGSEGQDCSHLECAAHTVTLSLTYLCQASLGVHQPIQQFIQGMGLDAHGDVGVRSSGYDRFPDNIHRILLMEGGYSP